MRKFEMTNKLDGIKFPKKKNGFKGTWDRTKFTMALNKMSTPKLNYNEKKGRIVLGKPKDEK